MSTGSVPRRFELHGALLVAGGALLFASKGIFAKLLYARGLTVEQLVTVRALFALPFFWAWGLLVHGRELFTIPRGPLIGAVIAGLLCYYLGTLLDFEALTLIDASLERAVLFSYPAIVVVALAVRDRRLPGAATVCATSLTYAGIALAATGLDPDRLRQNALGTLLVVLCAMTFASYFLLSERHMTVIGSVRFTVVAMTGAAAALLAHFLILHPDLPLAPSADAWPLMLGLVVFATVMSSFVLGEGIRRIGASRAALISTLGPPATIVYAALLLHERLTLLQLAGVALIIVGIVVVQVRR